MDCEAVSAESMDCEIANLHKALLCIFLQFFYVKDFSHILIMIQKLYYCCL